MIKAACFGTVLTATVALILGSQGTSAGPLAVESLNVAEFQFYWSWPIFAAGTGLCWGLIWLQR